MQMQNEQKMSKGQIFAEVVHSLVWLAIGAILFCSIFFQ